MKANELKLPDAMSKSLIIKAAGSHYALGLEHGYVFPSTKAQVNRFNSAGWVLGMMNKKDVQMVENILNKHGFEGDYTYTKSGAYVRLNNTSDLRAALKKEYCKQAKN